MSYRWSSFGGYRASINFNQPLGDKLAIDAAALYDSRGFERKPSSDLYRRQYVALAFQPTKNTSITASYEHFNNHNRRPNYESPIDFTTPWLQAGRPGYNPVTAMVTIMDTGKVMGPYVTSTKDPMSYGDRRDHERPDRQHIGVVRARHRVRVRPQSHVGRPGQCARIL